MITKFPRPCQRKSQKELRLLTSYDCERTERNFGIPSFAGCYQEHLSIKMMYMYYGIFTEIHSSPKEHDASSPVPGGVQFYEFTLFEARNLKPKCNFYPPMFIEKGMCIHHC